MRPTLPTASLVSAKIGPVHLGRDAYVYVRQSTLTQTTDEEAVDLVRRLAAHYDDTTIRDDLVPTAPPHQHRTPVHQEPGQIAARLPRHPRPPTASRCQRRRQ